MSDTIHKAVLGACYEFLKPIVRLLVRNGVGYREFSETAKAAFVKVTTDDYGIRGRKTNISRVAVMTGLSRKEIKRIRDGLADRATAGATATRPPERLLHLWHTAPDFIDRRGLPRKLRFDGPGACFKSLVSRSGGDIPPKAMLKELLRAGSVVIDGDKLRVVSGFCMPGPNDPEAIRVAGGALRHLACTINHNLRCDDPQALFFERRVSCDRLLNSQRSRFRKFATEKADLMLQELNSWLSDKALDAMPSADGKGGAGLAPSMGVGIYFFDDSASPDQPKEVI